MKAIAIQAFGGPEGLAVIEVPDPVPGDGQVLIETEASGVGGVDQLIRSGVLGAYGFKPGHILGSEVAGTVSAVGDGVDPGWFGRRVWAFVGLQGGYAERAVAPVTATVPLPDGRSAVDAVTLGSSGAVAHFALRHAHFAPGESVLVRGAAGGLGTMAVQLAARGGASAIAVTTSLAERGERLRALGATHVLDRAGEAEDAPEGFDVIIDIVAGPDLPAFLDKLNPNGRLVAIGLMGGPPPADFGLRLFAAFQQSRSFATFSLDTVPDADRFAATADVLAGDLEAVVHAVLPLDHAVRAHALLDAGGVFGRLALTPPGRDGA
ncbi:zinc-binding dehydrogenase [Solirubrobacter phytolaccae]|uniref:Zinc-binding dehydrogenase n=1 Tax=Solirubrobacter phytolaccae TaxID=1404360 RepID=A0A9X3N548_9ACTN|nr:zinc-binding dehydrogenase [Solirubrobacter phytolaccae]MDA0179819.1 zinc-binding dehydrogenase [Solirubrobacter phytolaccae]